jgi:hypothetical protein
MKGLTRFTALVFVLAIALSVGYSGTAWAKGKDAYEVRDAINDWGGNPAVHGGSGTITASVSGNVVTVEGEVTGATDKLQIDGIDGVTIHWKAKASRDPNNNDSVFGRLIGLTGTGELIVEDGGVIQGKHDSLLVDEPHPSGVYGPYFPTAIDITVKSGGEVSSSGADRGGAIKNLSDTGGSITVESGGKVISPKGNAICLGNSTYPTPPPGDVYKGVLTLGENATIVGLVSLDYGFTLKDAKYKEQTVELKDGRVWAYGDFEIGDELFAGENYYSSNLIVRSGSSVKWTAKDIPAQVVSIYLEEGSKFILKEELKIRYEAIFSGDGKLILDPDPGTLRVENGATLEILAKLVNDHEIIVEKGGTLEIKGPISGEGIIGNDGTIKATDIETVRSMLTADSTGELISLNNAPPDGGGGGGGGCSTGTVGIVTLILAGFLALKKKHS